LIRLTKLDNSQILLSIDNVKYVESTPDTLVFFTNGEHLFVKETLDELLHRVVEYKKQVTQPSDK